MKRKTNLFYNSNSQDSNFLTFSNYTESMTGNFLATDNKLYPSSFLCLDIPRLYDYESAAAVYSGKNKDTIKAETEKINNITLDDIEFYVVSGVVSIGNQTYHEPVYSSDMLGDQIQNDFIKDYLHDEFLSIIKAAAMAFLNNENYNLFVPIEGVDCIEIIDSNMIPMTQSVSDDNPHNIVAIALTTLDVSNYDEIEKPLPEDEMPASEKYLLNKTDFMKRYLVAHYENKLAYLRDYCSYNDLLAESTLLPLNYLIETILEYDPTTSIKYIGDVTEQDYNGTFADTICVIDTSKYTYGEIVSGSYITSSVDVLGESNSYLYGWSSNKDNYNPSYDFNKDGKITLSIASDNNYLFKDNPTFQYIKQELLYTYNISDNDDYNTYVLSNSTSTILDDTKENYLDTLDKIITYAKIVEQYNGPSLYKDISPKYDGTNISSYSYYYSYSSNLSHIMLKQVDKVTSDVNSIKEVKFNVLIPLYDMIDNNYKTDQRVLSSMSYIPLQNKSKYSLKNQEMYVQYVPLGMWFSGTDYVSLKRDPINQYSTTWSLCLSSQFKPFPYSTYMPSELSDTAKSDAFMTFAQILTKQNDLIDNMTNIQLTLESLSQRLNALESKTSSMATSYNLDSFNYEFADYKNYVNNQITYLKDSIDDMTLKWVNKEG